MNAAAYLTELTGTGIQVTRDGDNLRVRAVPGCSLAPYVEHIRQHKPALLAELVKAEIIAAATVDPAVFRRAEYERLMERWMAHESGRESA